MTTSPTHDHRHGAAERRPLRRLGVAAIALSALALAGTGCDDNDTDTSASRPESSASAPETSASTPDTSAPAPETSAPAPDTSPPDTSASAPDTVEDAPTSSAPAATTVPPTTVPPTTTVAPSPSLPINPIEIDDGSFESLEAMSAAADLIVVGVVTEEISLGRPAGLGSDGVEYLGLTIDAGNVLKGPLSGQVRLGWSAYATDSSGNRTAENEFNGIPVPHIGDELVLYLRAADAQFAELLGGFPTYTPIGLDGIGFVVDGTVSITDSSSPNSAPLRGKTVAELGAAI